MRAGGTLGSPGFNEGNQASPTRWQDATKGAGIMMTLRNTLGAAAVLAMLATSAYGQSGGIRNSAHNFSSYAWSGQEICKPCHIPHNGNATAGALWNHTLSSATYTLFEGASSAAGGADALDRVSLLCLSCHDGTVALDSFG